jgi:hypothetical protein
MPERIEVRSTRTGGVDYIERPTNEEAYIAALFRERRGYEINGDAELVEAVNKELRRLGALEETAGERDGTEQRQGNRRRAADAGGGRAAAKRR